MPLKLALESKQISEKESAKNNTNALAREIMGRVYELLKKGLKESAKRQGKSWQQKCKRRGQQMQRR